MRRSVLLIVVMLVAACSTASKQTEPATVAPDDAMERQVVVEPAEPPPLLWRVEGANGPLYLFGTMHFGVTPADLPTVVVERMKSCDLFVIEANPNGADPVELADLMMLPDGPSLDEKLGEERWARLLELIDGEFEPRVAKRLQPWVLEAVLIRRVVSNDASLESVLLSKAARREMSVQYLEDWRTQVEMLNDATGVDALAEIVDDPDGFASRMEQMTDDYLEGNVEALEGHIFGPDYAPDALFGERNETWLPRLEELAGRGNVFVAVGAGHLIGEHSVVEMLRERGYAVERVE